jgi:hypothetical protein
MLIKIELKGLILVTTDKELFVEPEEYEKLQDTFRCKTEYDNGRIIMHSGTSIKHNNIVLNINMYLRLFLKNSKCNAFTEQSGYIVQYGLIEGAYRITNTFHQGDTFVSFVFDEFKMKLHEIFENGENDFVCEE